MSHLVLKVLDFLLVLFQFQHILLQLVFDVHQLRLLLCLFVLNGFNFTLNSFQNCLVFLQFSL